MEIERKTVINATTEHVWELLGPGFANIGDWFSGVLASNALEAEAPSSATPSGQDGAACDISGRVCATSQGELTERITHYDDDARQFSFLVTDGLPGFVVEAGNTFSVTDLGDGRSELSFRVKIELKPVASVLMGWLFRRKVNETADQIMADFKVYAETGRVSERKQQVDRKLARKRAA